MKIRKYPISREYLPLSMYTPSISRRGIELANKLYRMPKSLYRDPELRIETVKIPGYKDGEIELLRASRSLLRASISSMEEVSYSKQLRLITDAPQA